MTDTFNPKLDGERLGKQLAAVREHMLFAAALGSWWTLRELEWALGYPQASISARLRELRKHGYRVERRRRGEPKRGLWEYSVRKKDPEQLKLIA